MPGTATSSARMGAQKFNTRYATFGFSDKANLDEGAMWPVAFALKELTATEEARIGALVKKAVTSGLISPLAPALGGIYFAGLRVTPRGPSDGCGLRGA